MAEIVERTDGIPLFVEEMTKAVLEAESEGEAARTAAAVPSPALAVPASLARLADGAARPARPRQGGGADRSGDRAGVLACPAGCGGAQAGGGVAIGARPSHCGRFAVSAGCAAACDLSVQARPGAGRGLRHACCASRDARCTPASPKRSKANSPRSPRASRSCWRVTAPRPDWIEKAASLWGKAGQRSLDRSALVEAVEQLTRALDQIATLPAHARAASRADQASGRAHNPTHPRQRVCRTGNQGGGGAGTFADRSKLKRSESLPKTRSCCSRSSTAFGSRVI